MDESRKPLRQRVAERRAGIEDDGESETARLWRRRIGRAGNIVQLVAILLLVYEILPLLSDDPGETTNYSRIAIYAIVFVLGRVIRSAVDIMKSLR